MDLVNWMLWAESVVSTVTVVALLGLLVAWVVEGYLPHGDKHDDHHLPGAGSRA